jgi:periplasmic protein TonB
VSRENDSNVGKVSSLVDALRRDSPATGAPAGAALRRPAAGGPTRALDGGGLFVPRPSYVPEPALPWSIGRTDDGMYRRLGAMSSVLFFLLSSVLIFYKPPAVDRLEKDKISPRLAKLVLERKEPPKVEPVKIEKKPEEKKPEELKPTETKPTEAPKEVRQEVVREPSKKPTSQEVAEAREKASKTGLVAMRDQLAALRDLGNADSLRQEQTQVGSEGTERRVERDLIGKAATAGSGGVATKSIAHSGGGTLQGRQTARVSGPAGGGPSLAEVEREAKGSKRTAEEIKLAFDANKSAIYGIYRRALRANPLLEGRVVLKLTIDPSGQVTSCTIVSSALKDPELEEKLVARVQLISFGTRPKLETWTGTYHIDFVPSG